MSFNGKTIVTGATSGIGRATAQAFAGEGADVVLVGRSKGALSDLSRLLEGPGRRSATRTADVTASDAPERIVRTAIEAFGESTCWRHLTCLR